MAPVEKYVRGAVTFSQLDGREWCLLPVDVVTGLVKILKLKFRQNLKLEFGRYFVADVL